MAPKFNSKHLTKGDPEPPYTGKLRLYNLRFGPFAERVVFALNAKNLDYEVVNVNYTAKPEWFERKTPYGKLPALEIKEDLCISESLAIVEYIDEVYPQRPLISKDPIRRAFDAVIIQASMSVQEYFYAALITSDVRKDILLSYHRNLAYIQDQLKERGTKFLSGNEPGYVDYMIWPCFERFLAFKNEGDQFKFDPVKHQPLLVYFERMQKDPIVSQYAVPDEKMVKIYQPYRQPYDPNNVVIHNIDED